MEYHIIVVGRTGDHPGSRIFLLGPGSKKGAFRTAEDTFRRENRLAKSVALLSRCVFSGSEEDGHEFMRRLEERVTAKASEKLSEMMIDGEGVTNG